MKKFLPYILILAVVAVGALGPFSATKSSAATTTPVTASTAGAGSGLDKVAPSGGYCTPGVVEGFDLQKCIASIMYNVAVAPSSVILWISGQIFNTSVLFSLNGKTLKQDFVSAGWAVTRNVANLFFIFILLYISIATILQLSGYGMKDLLVKVIILALLVNFSLLIAGFIIDGSNILALEFYNKMPPAEQGSITQIIFGAGTKDISSVFISGFNPQNMFSVDRFNSWTKSGGNLLYMFILFLCAIIINLIASFILLAGAILFIIRIAVLWILMILAPLAFVAMALPATKQYASQWWDKLFHQSFFAPAFLFMFYMTAKLVESGFLKGKNLPGGGSMPSENFFGNLAIILLYFSIVAVFLVASLIVAKQMGAVGASTMQSWGQSAKKWGQAKAGRIGKRYVGRAATAAEGALEKGEGTFAKTLRAFPLFQRGLARTAQLTKKEVGKYEKDFGSYDTQTLNQLRGKMGTTKEARVAIDKILAKRSAKTAPGEKDEARLKQIDQELEKSKQLIPGGTQTFKEFYESQAVENEAKLASMPLDSSTDGVKKRAEVILKRKKAEQKIREIENLEKEKKEIEVNRQKRKEMEELEERVGVAERKAGEASEKASSKPPPSAS